MNDFAHGGIYGGLIITVLMTTTAMALWFERKMAGRMQSRMGPTIVGPFGLLQPVADVVKLLQKEDIIPEKADSALFNLAPPLGAIAAIAVAAVVPFSPTVIAADLDVGVLYLLAVGAMGTGAYFLLSDATPPIQAGPAGLRFRVFFNAAETQLVAGGAW